ncbi:MAG TPA: hypothetical protein VLQ66_03410, partial [Paenisporosarcina sp.]|nr:hypothetical protein [Paenisporosarcina sp.]
ISRATDGFSASTTDFDKLSTLTSCKFILMSHERIFVDYQRLARFYERFLVDYQRLARFYERISYNQTISSKTGG